MVIIMEKTRNYYLRLVKQNRNYKEMLKNYVLSFLFSGLISIIGQLFFDFYNHILNFNKNDSSLFMTLSIIFITGILTLLGIYDNLGQIAKAGLVIPISGFANSAVSAAMEYHKEGLILGIGANTLKLAGSVLVLGTFSAILVSIIRYFFEVLI